MFNDAIMGEHSEDSDARGYAQGVADARRNLPARYIMTDLGPVASSDNTACEGYTYADAYCDGYADCMLARDDRDLVQFLQEMESGR